MQTCPTYTADDMAELLNLKRATFLRKRKELIEQGMPRPVSGTTVWARTLVNAWLEGGVFAGGTFCLDPIAAQTAALEARIGQ